MKAVMCVATLAVATATVEHIGGYAGDFTQAGRRPAAGGGGGGGKGGGGRGGGGGGGG